MRPPLFFSDHKESRDTDPAVLAMRWDDPDGQWKMFFEGRLARYGDGKPFALYDLASDPQETTNRINEEALAPLVKSMTEMALTHRRVGGHRFATVTPSRRAVFDWQDNSPLRTSFEGQPAAGFSTTVGGVKLTLKSSAADAHFSVNERGLGVDGGKFRQVDDGEALLLQFDRKVLIESVSLVAGDGVCGGFWHKGDQAPLAIYCVDADQDYEDQQGSITDLGVLGAGEVLRLDSASHFGVEKPGRWRLGSIAVRAL
ncbi:MAG: hypothetical protein AAF191_06655 [Verrucomicrobiota bacterium]